MEDAKEYLKKIIVDKYGREWDGGVTTASKDNILREINRLAPMLEDYAKQENESLKQSLRAISEVTVDGELPLLKKIHIIASKALK